MFAVDGTQIGELGPVDAPEFAEKLSSKLRKILRVQQLLDLRTENGAAQSAIRFCVDDQEYAAPATGAPDGKAADAPAETRCAGNCHGEQRIG